MSADSGAWQIRELLQLAIAAHELLPLRFSVVLGGKTYAGAAGELHREITGEQALRFGWDPAHKHPHIKQEMKFLFGSTTLTSADGAKLDCDHLRHGDDWRLRCKKPSGGEVALRRVRE